MKLDWMNQGREFVPKTTLRDVRTVLQGEVDSLEEVQRRLAAGEDAVAVRKRVALASVDASVAVIAGILARTDPTVTSDRVLDNVSPAAMEGLVEALITDPQKAHEAGNAAEKEVAAADAAVAVAEPGG